MVIEARAVQELNAYDPIEITVSGIATETRAVQELNA